MKDNVIYYLDKIVNYIVEDTVISKTGIYCIFPFFDDEPNRKFYLLDFEGCDIADMIEDKFFIYCENTYCLDSQESLYVWNNWKFIFVDKVNNKLSYGSGV